jgi:hypothetical protein
MEILNTRVERVRVTFRSDDPDYDWMSEVSNQPGYEFLTCSKIANNENPKWPKWTFIIDYKRNIK